MPWFRVDDQFWSHPKIMGLPPASIALWVRAGSWSMQHLTDGFVPATVLPMLGATKGSVKPLADAGLWHSADKGWQFHDWDKYQEKAEVLKKNREDAKERMRKVRDAKAARRSGERSGEHSGERSQERSGDVRSAHIHVHTTYGDDVLSSPVLNREGSDSDGGESLEAVCARQAKAIYDVDYMKVRNVVGVAVGGIPNPSGVLRIIAQIIDRAHKPVASPTGLCITSVRNDWAEWQQFLHEEGLVA